MKHEHKGKSGRDIINPDAILNHVPVQLGDTFLDVGCGDGFFSERAAHAVGENGIVIAIDVDKEAVEKLDSLGIENIKTIVADATKSIPVEDRSADIILMCNVLHGFAANEELSSVLPELNRVLAKDGRIVVVEFTLTSPKGPPEEVRIPPEKLEEVMTGFEVLETFNAGPFSYGALIRRQINK